jgi:6-phosphogluconolactonase
MRKISLGVAVALALGCSKAATEGPKPGPPGDTGGSGGSPARGGAGGGQPTGGTGGSSASGGSPGTGGGATGGSGGGATGGSGGGAGAGGGSGSGGGMGSGGASGTGGSRDGGGAPADAEVVTPPPPLTGKAFVYAASFEGGSMLTTFQLDLGTGALTRVGAGTAAGSSPDYVAIHPDGKLLFVNNEVSGGRATAMAIGADGALTKLNDQPSGGGGPAHIWAHKSGKWVLSANYNDGKVAALPVGEDGKLGPPVSVQTAGSNAHMVLDDGQTGGFVFVPCADAQHVAMYRFDVASGKLTPNTPATIAAPMRPRHMAFNPNGKFAYLTHESRGAITTFAYDQASGLLSAPRDTTAPGDGAHVLVHPTGNFVFHIARGGGAITVFKVAADGALSSAGSMAISSPYDATLTRDGKYLIVVGGTSVRVFSINAATGALGAAGTGQSVQRSQGVAVTVL